MTTELHRAFTSLGKPAAGQAGCRQAVAALLSELLGERRERACRSGRSLGRWWTARRTMCAWPMCRCGWAAPKLDNTHGDHRGDGGEQHAVAADDDREALARSLWLATNTGYGTALDNYLAREDRGRGASQGRRQLAGLQPGDAADLHWQAGAAGGGGPRGVGETGARRCRRSFASFRMSTRTW